MKRFYLISLALALLLVLLATGCGRKQNDNIKTQSAKTAQSVSADAASQTTEAAARAEAAGLLSADKAMVAPDWSLPGINGKTRTLSEFRGKVVILDFWDTWCPPCKKEIPGFIELQDAYGDRGLIVIGAAFGRDGEGAVADFVKEYGINYPVVIANADVARNYGGIRSIPTTFVIDREGRARAMHVGFASKDTFEKEILALL